MNNNKGNMNKKPKRQAKNQEGEDSRFKWDSRFKRMAKKENKKMDKRFSQAMKSDKFKDNDTVDKYGRKLKEEDEELELEKDIEQEEKEQGDNEEVEIEYEKGVEEAMKEDEAIPRGEATSQLAVMNCDWDNTTAQDLFVLLSNALPSTGKLFRVEIRPSNYGMEKMHEEEVEGLPKSVWKEDVMDEVEIFEDKKLEDDDYIPTFTVVPDSELGKVRDDLKDDEDDNDEDALKRLQAEDDDENDFDLGLQPVKKDKSGPVKGTKDEVVPMDLIDKDKLAEYQEQKKKYYFGVAVFDSVETANYVYENVDGEELEFAYDPLDLRFIPEGTEFPYEPTDICNEYKKIATFTNKAKNSKVKLNWEETEQRRTNALTKRWEDMDEEDILRDEDLYKEFIEHDSDYEDDDVQKDDAEELRKKYAILLGDTNEIKKMEEEESDDNGEKISTFMTSAADIVKSKKETKEEKRERERKKEELELLMTDDIKDSADAAKVMKRFDDDDDNNEYKEKEEKEKVIGDDFLDNKGVKKAKKFNKNGKKSKKDKMDKDFNVDLQDKRFAKLLDSDDFNIDTSNPEFVATKGMKEVLKEKHRRFNKKMSGNKK